MRRSDAVRIVVTGVLVAGMGGCAGSATPKDLAPDAIYRPGHSAEELGDRYAGGKPVWVVDQVPADPFAAATMREIVALGKPRPTTYQVFTRARLDHGGGRYHDYVFYDSAHRVIYVARRRD